jgi:S-adenosylmethionine hydrolase
MLAVLLAKIVAVGTITLYMRSLISTTFHYRTMFAYVADILDIPRRGDQNHQRPEFLALIRASAAQSVAPWSCANPERK